ncbi:MAG: hypothetical protein WJ289_07520 [Ferrovum myxofaciens]
MNRLLLTPFGLKWNPFNTELPTEALYLSPKINDFFWRIEQVHVREGGFALIQGDPGTGKSVALRALAERLERQTDLTVGILNHPRATSGISTANWPRSSASCSNPATAGADSRSCGSAGSVTSKPPGPAVVCSLMRPRK